MAARWRPPLATLALAAAAVVTDASPTLSDALSLERVGVERGQVWRLLTGHLVHEVPRVAVLDLGMLLLLGAWIENRSRSLFGAVLFASAVLSSLAFWLFTGFERSVGSSGLVCGLLAAAVVLAFRDGRRALAVAVGAVFGAKLALELLGLWPAALGGLPPGYALATEAHLGGLAGGAVTALTYRRRRPAE